MADQIHAQSDTETGAWTLLVHDDTTTTSTTTSDLDNAQPQNPSNFTTTAVAGTKICSRPLKRTKLSPETSDTEPKQTTNSTVIVAVDHSKHNTTIKTTKNIIVASKLKPVPRIIGRPLSCEGEIEIALRHLLAADPLLAPLINLHLPPTLEPSQLPFLALTKSILYQQLAYKAGASIYARFVSLCGGEAGVLPDIVLSLTPQQLRQIGVSGRKASYLHDLARKYQNGILSDSSIVEMDDKSLFTMLTMVNGIGSWSVHMFMIFSLHRPDVLPIHDPNIRKGVQLLYGLEELPKPSQMELLCEKWRPYRSVASWYLWRFGEAKMSPSSAVALSASTVDLQHQQQRQEQEPELLQFQLQQQQFLDPINGILNLGACAWRD